MKLPKPPRTWARLVVLLLWCCPIASSTRQARGADAVGDFLERHCFECHDDAARAGDLDLSALKSDVADPSAFAAWVKVHDRLEAGEMPPKDKVAARPPGAATAALLRAPAARLRDADPAPPRRAGRARG